MILTAIVGSYNRGGVVESAVDEILSAAQACGATVRKVHLLDCHIEFCRNCQACTQEPGPSRGRCPIEDDMGGLLDALEGSDAIVLASPMNFWTVTALTKRFIERLVCYAYWPWNQNGPKARPRVREKRAIVVGSSAAPGFLSRWLTGMPGLMKSAVKLLGAGRVQTLFIGLSRHRPGFELREKDRARSAKMGRWVAGA